ncbi:hypothetical protein CTI12_AA274770 [Artemisia annua]|uniref:Uncharacterized protein n=1 Tax=Artemisia annua TaxID=35608 RepID=A0A2U1NER5_ARTAN|nr:hypothetical protein CTI12_AA274770 [Artemisia annua]
MNNDNTSIFLVYVPKEDLESLAWIIALLMLIMVLAVRDIRGVTSNRDSCSRRDSGVFHWLGRPTNWLLYALPSDI